MKITGGTRILGLIGNPVEHSVSPAMHNAAFEALNLDYVYLPLLTPRDKLEQVLDCLMHLGALGVNVTIPYKHDVMPFMDEIHPLALRIGAVNTILFKKGRKIGYNTDGAGFTTSLEIEAGFCCTGKQVVIIGAGGAAYSVASRCLELGVKNLVIANRTVSRAEALKSHLIKNFDQDVFSIGLTDPGLAGKIAVADLVINTTSLGLSGDDASPVPGEWFRRGQLAADLIYNPLRTTFLKEADQRGLKTINGLGMLIYQGVLAFKIWTGIDPPVEVMRAAVEDALNITYRG